MPHGAEQLRGRDSIETRKGRARDAQMALHSSQALRCRLVEVSTWLGCCQLEAMTGFSSGNVLISAHRESWAASERMPLDWALLGRRRQMGSSGYGQALGAQETSPSGCFRKVSFVFQNLLGKAPFPSLPTPLPTWHQRASPQRHNYESHARMLIAASDLPSQNKRIALPN